MTSNTASTPNASMASSSGSASGAFTAAASISRLKAVCIYNPTITNKEDMAHQNILAYYPPDTPLNEQMNETGLCSATEQLHERFSSLFNFFRPMPLSATGVPGYAANLSASRVGRPSSPLSARQNHSFCAAAAAATGGGGISPITPSGPQHHHQQQQQQDVPFAMNVKSITCTSKRYTVAEVEEDWFVMVITGRPRREVAATEDDSDDRVVALLREHVTICHSIFKLVYGSLSANFAHFRQTQDGEGKAAMVATLKRMQVLVGTGLLGRLVPTLSDALREIAGSFSVPAGIEYLSIGKHAYLVVSSLVSLLQSAHPGAVRTAVVAYGGKIVYSGLSIQNTFSLYRILSGAMAAGGVGSGGGGGIGGGASNTSLGDASFGSASTATTGAGGGEENSSNNRNVYETLARVRQFTSQQRTPSGNYTGFLHLLQQQFPDDHNNLGDSGAASSGTGSSQTNSKTRVDKKKQAAAIQRAHIAAAAASADPSAAASAANRYIPLLHIDNQLVGVLTYCVGDFRIFVIAESKFIERPELCAGLMEGISQIMQHEGNEQLRSILVPSVITTKELDDRFIYYYSNKMNLAVKTSVMSRRNTSLEREALQVMDMLRHALIRPTTGHHVQGGRSNLAADYYSTPTTTTTMAATNNVAAHQFPPCCEGDDEEHQQQEREQEGEEASFRNQQQHHQQRQHRGEYYRTLIEGRHAVTSGAGCGGGGGCGAVAQRLLMPHTAGSFQSHLKALVLRDVEAYWHMKKQWRRQVNAATCAGVNNNNEEELLDDGEQTQNEQFEKIIEDWSSTLLASTQFGDEQQQQQQSKSGRSSSAAQQHQRRSTGHSSTGSGSTRGSAAVPLEQRTPVIFSSRGSHQQQNVANEAAIDRILFGDGEHASGNLSAFADDEPHTRPHFLDMYRRGGGKGREDGIVEVLVRLRSNLWVSCIGSGSREFMLAIDASSLEEALAEIRFVSKYVFVGIFVD